MVEFGSDEKFFIIVGILFILGAIARVFSTFFGLYEDITSTQALFFDILGAFGGFISLVIGIESALE